MKTSKEYKFEQRSFYPWLGSIIVQINLNLNPRIFRLESHAYETELWAQFSIIVKYHSLNLLTQSNKELIESVAWTYLQLYWRKASGEGGGI